MDTLDHNQDWPTTTNEIVTAYVQKPLFSSHRPYVDCCLQIQIDFPESESYIYFKPILLILFEHLLIVYKSTKALLDIVMIPWRLKQKTNKNTIPQLKISRAQKSWYDVTG